MRLLLALAFALLLASLAGATTYGLTGGFEYPNALPDAAELGAQGARVQCYWQQVEPAPGAYTFGWFDGMVAAAQGRELTITFRARSTWASTRDRSAAPTATTPPLDLNAYAAVLQALAERSAGKVTRWQIENEVEFAKYWAGTVTQYLDLYQTARQAIKEVDPTANVIMGGFCSATTLGEAPKMGRRALELLRGVEALGAEEVDFHSYHYFDSCVAQVVQLRRYTSLPLVCTETGGPDLQYLPDSEATNAEEVVKRLTLLSSLGVRTINWLPLRQSEDGSRFGQLGLVRSDGTKKPSFYSYQQFLKLLGAGSFVTDESTDLVSIYRFRSPEAETRVLWAPVATTVPLTISGTTASLVDLYGATTSLPVDTRTQQVSVAVGPEPVYLVE